MFTAGEVDGHELKVETFLGQRRYDSLCACGHGHTVESDGHRVFLSLAADDCWQEGGKSASSFP